MTVVQKQAALLLLLVSLAGAQNTRPASLQSVKVTHAGRDVRIEVSLTAVVTPSVVTAIHPDRLVLELPHTTVSAKQQPIPVYSDGVRVVRFGLHQADPAITRVVVELDQAQPYALETNGTHVILTVSPEVVANHHVAPAAAAAGGFIAVFRHQQDSQPAPPGNDQDAQIPAVPPSGPPINSPSSQAESSPTASPTGPAASASHPNYGSLQQGTVFPSSGTPGSGTVPPVSNGASGSFDGATRASATAKTPAPVASVMPAAAASTSASTPAVSPDSSRAPAETQPGSTTATAPPSHPSLHPLGSAAGTVAETSPTVASVPAAAQAPPTASAEPAASSASLPVAQAPSPSVAEVHPGSATGSVSQNTQPPEPAGQTVATYAAAVADLKPVPIDPEPAPAASDADLQMEALRAANPDLRTVFKVKYVADGVAYLDGGRSDGLAEGMKLEIKDSNLAPRPGEVADPRDPRVVAELEVNGVADTSAVTDIHTPKRPVKAGDLAYLSLADAQALIAQQTLSATRKYPAVVTFTEGDPLEEEARAEVPKPPPPSMNRARGRIGVDYFSTVSHGSSSITSSDLGLVVRTDITRLNGTYWNISGYWRGRLQATSGTGPQTLQDLINRTYHLSMTYDNPNSAWVAGFGRLYLPWAPSLETIDGGYFGRRLGHGATLGLFAGSTPDPTSYSYNPNQQIAGTFINFDGGSYDAWKYTSTSGIGVAAINFTLQRPFIFFENGLFYKRLFSIYDSLQADNPVGNPATPSPGPGLSRNFLTVRVQPHPRLEFDLNENYFRDIPTFDPALIGTGLLDKYLFQGFSVGGRVEVLKGIFLYTTQGQSNRSGDAKNSLNQAYGITFNRLPKIDLRTDLHYSRFSSSFGSGSYEALSLSRNLSETLRLEMLVGQQNFTSTLTNAGHSRFINGNVETTFGAHYFLQGGLGFNRGDLSYDQWHFTLGYRFDTKGQGKR
jgi:hypothetical protein